MDTLHTLEIRPLPWSDNRTAARILARAMRDNPVHVSAFGADPGRRERRLIRFFNTMIPLIQSRARVIAAFDGDAPIGILGMMPPGACRLAPVHVLRLVPSLLAGNSPAGAVRVARWLGAWRKNDPRAPHWHLGPLAVDVTLQEKGVGSRLMTECCNHMDALGAMSYLETDKAINVEFYEKFGFVITKKERILGVPNWFMTRRADHPQGRRAASR